MNAYAGPDQIHFQASSTSTAPWQDAVGTGTRFRSGHSDERGLLARLAATLHWVAEQPRRRAVIAELQSLSDRELADIGLGRNELARVFDRGFVGRHSDVI